MDTEGATIAFAEAFGNSQVRVPHSDGSLESSFIEHQRGKISQVYGQSNKASLFLVALFFYVLNCR